MDNKISSKWKTILDSFNNSRLESGLGNYIDSNDLYNNLYLTYTDSGNYASVLPMALKVASKTMAADLVGVNPYYNKGIISYKLAKVLYENCNYEEPVEYYFVDSNYGYSLEHVYNYPNYKFINTYHDKDENYIGVNSKYAAPYFKDVLTWLSKDNNYAKYSSIIFNIKDYLYYKNKDKEDFQPMGSPSGQLFYMDFKRGI